MGRPAAVLVTLLFLLSAVGIGQANAAVDCAVAVQVVDRAICDDSDMIRDEENLDRAYGDLLDGLGEGQWIALQGDQSVWLDRRRRCLDYSQGRVADRACIQRETGDRIRLFRGEPEFSGPHAPRFRPAFYYRKAPEALISMVWPQAEGAGMAPFNALLNQSMVDMKVLPGVVGGPFGLDEVPFLIKIERYRIQYASAKLISIIFDGYEDIGGAHPFGSSYSLNYLPERARPLALDDVVDSEALARLLPVCRADILAERERRGDGPWKLEPVVRDGFISGAIINIGNWSFDRDGVIIEYTDYSDGERSYDCQIPWAELKAVAKRNAPLPFE